MPRSTTQNEKMREATITAVINAAMTLFAKNGYAHTSTRAIAKEANISTGLMYHYFSGKETLLKAVFEQCMAIIDQDLHGPCNVTSQGERIPAILHALFDLLAEKAALWAMFYMLRTQPSIMRVLGDDFRFRTAALRGCIEEELQFLNHPDPRIGAHLLYCFIEGTIQQYLLEPENYPLEQVVGEIIRQYGAGGM